MKKVFFLIAFLFTVVCYAAPPPDKLTSFLTEDVGVIRSQGDFAVQTIQMQEVANIFWGVIYTYVNESALTNDFLIMPDVEVTEGVIMNRNCLYDNYGYHPDKQKSNLSYPFGGNYVS